MSSEEDLSVLKGLVKYLQSKKITSFQWHNFKKGLKNQESPFLLPPYLTTWTRSEIVWLLSIYRFSYVPVYTYYN